MQNDLCVQPKQSKTRPLVRRSRRLTTSASRVGTSKGALDSLSKPFRKLSNGSVLLSAEAWQKLVHIMVMAAHRHSNPIQLAECSDGGMLELRRMILESDSELLKLT